MHTRIKSVRQALNLSQREFAEKLGVSQVTVSTWERGQVARFAPPLICQKFKVNPEWLETGSGEMFMRPRIERETFVESMVAMYNLLPPERQKLWQAFAYRILSDRWKNQTVESFARSFSEADAEIDLTPPR